MNILVIGGEGFTGVHFRNRMTEEGSRGEVRSVSRRTQPALDLLNPKSISQALQGNAPDAVVCLAACIRSQDPLDFYRINVCGTENLLIALRESGFSGRLLVVGSSSIYGELAAPLDGASGHQEESALPRPLSHYGWSMMAREEAVKTYTKGAAFSSILTRTFNLVGPQMPEYLAFARFSASTARFLQGKQDGVEVGSLTGIRDFVDVRDACNAYRSLLSTEVAAGTTEVFNIASSLGTPIGRFFDVAEKHTGRKILLRENPSWKNPREVKGQVGSYNKLNQACGWTPKIPLDQSIQELLDLALAP